MNSPPAFSRGGVLALVLGGFALLVAGLYLIGTGSGLGGDETDAQAHAAATGLNGYAGLSALAEAQGYAVTLSRSHETRTAQGLLVLTPPASSRAEDIAAILAERSERGPTLVILPKWTAIPPSAQLTNDQRRSFRRGWVILTGGQLAPWPALLPPPFRFAHRPVPAVSGAGPARWQGLGLHGVLPTAAGAYAAPAFAHDVLIADTGGRALAFAARRSANSVAKAEQYPVVFLVEPDLANNYGLADPVRAAAVMALVARMTADAQSSAVTFDLTLNGFGASENLLTLAFRPPFLAATLSLLVALLIVGWRGLRRFGPPATRGAPDIAFGKSQLIANGAGLIVRARRFGLLGAPYTAAMARRLADRLGLARPDPAAIDTALARRLPDEEPFTRRAARMQAARRPADILAAAQSLDALHSKLSQGQS
ncbi:DUF4350 domain-containing protein [Erythrobacter sp. R86502]|uniref:DUF4350 domain-containing protein n=1 Tax=Erythrobacter sp. R86502 TaxID=3093846 RepID=UPI0036D3EF6C